MGGNNHIREGYRVFLTDNLNLENDSEVRKYLLKKDIFLVIYFLIVPIFEFSLPILHIINFIGVILMIYFFKKDYRLGITSKIDKYYKNNKDILYILNLVITLLGIRILYYLMIIGILHSETVVVYYVCSSLRDYYIVEKF